MNQQISLFQLVANASLIVQIVIVILFFFSVVSWGIIIAKWKQIAKYKSDITIFNDEFQNNSSSISTLYSKTSGKTDNIALRSLFTKAIGEFNKLSRQTMSYKDIVISNLERALDSSLDEEMDKLGLNLELLATFSSSSPYIGLLGTVWGIMHAFLGLSSTQSQATLALVAPGIAEALITTAIGLFVAIPASIFYNRFSKDLDGIENKMIHFANNLLNIVSRKLTATNN